MSYRFSVYDLVKFALIDLVRLTRNTLALLGISIATEGPGMTLLPQVHFSDQLLSKISHVLPCMQTAITSLVCSYFLTPALVATETSQVSLHLSLRALK